MLTQFRVPHFSGFKCNPETIIILPHCLSVHFWLKAELLAISVLNSSSQINPLHPQRTKFTFVSRHPREDEWDCLWGGIHPPFRSVLLDLDYRNRTDYSNARSNLTHCRVHRADHRNQCHFIVAILTSKLSPCFWCLSEKHLIKLLGSSTNSCKGEILLVADIWVASTGLTVVLSHARNNGTTQ